jgi:hypothetical protein
VTNRPNEEIQLAIRLASEIDTATEQLALALNQMITHGWVARQPGAVFTSLAVGIERVLKLTIGEKARNEGGSFPTSWRGDRSGHDLETLYQEASVALETSAASAAPYLMGLLNQLDEDPYWPGILESLSMWAQASGRYADLDALAGKAGPSRHAWEPWESAEHQIFTDTNAWGRIDDDAIRRMRIRMAASVMIWWHTYYRAWQHGLISDRGKQFSSALAPNGVRHLNPALKALVVNR